MAAKIKTAQHEWKTVFDSAPWQGDDSPRWCATCGTQVRNVAATADAGDCAGAPADRVLTVKAIKTFQGMEGGGFNANLYENGKKLGLVIDDANGGCFNYQIDRAKLASLEAWARVKSGGGFEALDVIVSDLVADAQDMAWLRRTCKKKTVVRLKDSGPGEWIIYKAPYSDGLAAKIRAEYGDNLAEIANERKGL